MFLIINFPSYFLLYITHCQNTIIFQYSLLSIRISNPLCNVNHFTLITVSPWNIWKSLSLFLRFSLVKSFPAFSLFFDSLLFAIILLPCFHSFRKRSFSLILLITSSFCHHYFLDLTGYFFYSQVLFIIPSKTLLKIFQLPSNNGPWLTALFKLLDIRTKNTLEINFLK